MDRDGPGAHSEDFTHSRTVGCPLPINVDGRIGGRRLHNLTEEGWKREGEGIGGRWSRVGNYLTFGIEAVRFFAKTQDRLINLIEGGKPGAEARKTAHENDEKARGEFVESARMTQSTRSEEAFEWTQALK